MVRFGWRTLVTKLLSNMRRWLFALVAILGCSSAPKKPTGFRVALVTPGAITDGSWNEPAYHGLEAIRDSLGVAVSHIEARTPGAQEEALRTYAAQGYDVIFGHGFEFQKPAERVSASYPKPIFVVTAGERAEGRVAPLLFRLEEASFLAGMVAGGLSKTGKIGFVGGIELPPVRRGYQGWVQGAKQVNPAIETSATYLNNFDDAAAGREAALAMIRRGVDMIHHNADAAAVGAFQAAKENPGVYLFGANSDQVRLAPERVLGSAVIDIPHALLMVARQAKEGTFVPTAASFGLSSGVVRYAPNPALESLLSPELKARVAAARDSIAAGTLSPLPPPTS